MFLGFLPAFPRSMAQICPPPPRTPYKPAKTKHATPRQMRPFKAREPEHVEYLQHLRAGKRGGGFQTGEFPLFSGKVLIVSQTPFGNVRKEAKDKSRKSQTKSGKSWKIGKGQKTTKKVREGKQTKKKRKKRSRSDREAPPFDTPRISKKGQDYRSLGHADVKRNVSWFLGCFGIRQNHADTSGTIKRFFRQANRRFSGQYRALSNIFK